VPLDAKGVTVSPLFNIGGGRQNHTFLDDVTVDDDMRVGRLNEAWPLVMGTFYGGGGGGHRVPAIEHQQRLDAIVDYCTSTQRRGKVLAEDPAIQEKLAELALIVTSERLLTYDAAGAVASGSQPKYAGALNPVVVKEDTPRFAELCNEIIGPLGQLAAGSPLAPIGGKVEEWYRWSFRTHAGGTPQVKRMVLATRGLGLPR
jgi:alkylation response protein AidB-like acyl-CoA dehydrogenase